MRRFTPVACTFACLALIGYSITTSPIVAKDSDDAKSKTAKADSEGSSELPGCLEKLNLSDDQKGKAKEIAQKYNTKIEKTWKHFSEKYMETVRTEVALLAAVEDHLSDQQRDSVRSERHKSAHSDKDADKSKSSNEAAVNQSSAQNKQSSDKSDQANQKGNQNNAQPGAVVAEVQELVFSNGVTLTIEQEAIADQLTNKYIGHLRTLHREIHSLHNRLIALEADKLVELEKVLTKEQLTKLRDERQTMASHRHVTQAENRQRAND